MMLMSYLMFAFDLNQIFNVNFYVTNLKIRNLFAVAHLLSLIYHPILIEKQFIAQKNIVLFLFFKISFSYLYEFKAI